MRLAPQLLQPLDMKQVDKYVTNDDYTFEQKLDGDRMLIHVDEHGVHAANRRGERIATDARLIEAFGNMSGEWIFDGEWLDGTFWLFDMPYALGRVTPDTPRETRRTSLEAVYTAAFEHVKSVRLNDIARTPTQKRELLDWCRDNNAEGVVIKYLHGPYRPGKRMPEMFKVKFTETADCFIVEVGRQGKHSCGIGLYHGGKPREVGAIKMTDKDLAAANVGDIVEVKYLYMTNDLRLYGPAVFLRFRTDKTPDECTTDQCKMVNKTVRTVPKERPQ